LTSRYAILWIHKTHTISTVSKRAFPNPKCFDLFEVWHSGDFPKKKTQIFFILATKSSTKKLQGYQLFGFQEFCILLYLITQRVFIVKTSAWVRWKRIFLRKILKIKTQQQNFENWFESLEMELLKMHLFKKFMMNNYMTHDAYFL
jgi:hypothetical protein